MHRLRGMTTQGKTAGKRSAAKRVTKTSKTTRSNVRRTAKKRPARAGTASASRNAGDTTRRSASKPRARARAPHAEPASTSAGFILERPASRTQEATLQVPQGRATSEPSQPPTPHHGFQRAQLLANKGRALVATLRNMFTAVTQQLHLPHLPGKSHSLADSHRDAP